MIESPCQMLTPELAKASGGGIRGPPGRWCHRGFRDGGWFVWTGCTGGWVWVIQEGWAEMMVRGCSLCRWMAEVHRGLLGNEGGANWQLLDQGQSRPAEWCGVHLLQTTQSRSKVGWTLRLTTERSLPNAEISGVCLRTLFVYRCWMAWFGTCCVGSATRK